jgi:outer membrane protein OmpA-like peptidoglycan-associated protein
MRSRIITILSFCFLTWHTASAQIRTEPFFPYGNWSVGLGAGFSQIYGNLDHSNSEPVYRLDVARNLNMWMAVNLEVMHGALSDYEVKNTWTNGLSVYNQINAADLSLRVSLGEFFSYPRSFFQKQIFGLYGGVGIGFMSNNVSNITLKFRKLDKYSITDFSSKNIKTSSTNFFMPFNLGINLHVTRKVYFNINYQFSYAYSDYLDGYNFAAPTATNKYNDMFSVLSFGLNYYIGKVHYGKHDAAMTTANYSGNNIYNYSDAEKKALADAYDADGDGVPDKADKCPNTAAGAKVDATGCPLDTDGDGIPDYLDKCPDEKGVEANKGCPEGVAPAAAKPGDSDGDGVADKDDKCPATPKGVKVDATGCPLDRDGDTVPDYLDKCPDEKGSPDAAGCPVVNEKAKNALEQAIQGIVFESSKDIIDPVSFPILDNVVKVMKENPSYNLSINGYTDNKGKPETNRKLSEKRAIAVKKYLETHGVAGSRLKATGYGQENPIDDNNTEAGRKRNRRVELKVNF